MQSKGPSRETKILANELRPRFARVAQAVRRDTAAAGLTTAQSSVLNLLLVESPLRVSDLARAEAVKMPTMTQVVNRLASAGWVTRIRRAGKGHQLVDITKKGRRMAARVAVARNAALNRRIEKLSVIERDQLSRLTPLLDKMFEQKPWQVE
jgi:DNA-binding MarR family transcriptional regulator